MVPFLPDPIAFQPGTSTPIRFGSCFRNFDSDSVRFRYSDSDSVRFRYFDSDSVRLRYFVSDSVRLRFPYNNFDTDSVRFSIAGGEATMHRIQAQRQERRFIPQVIIYLSDERAHAYQASGTPRLPRSCNFHYIRSPIVLGVVEVAPTKV